MTSDYILVLECIGLFFLILFFSSFIIEMINRKTRLDSLLSGALMQLCFAFLSLVTALLLSDNAVSLLGLSFPSFNELAYGLLAAILFAFIGYIISEKASSKCAPPIELKNVREFVFLSFIFAPLGEELFFRGLLTGFLLYGGMFFSVSLFLPTVLFSLIHVIPFKDQGPSCVLRITSLSFFLGLLLGYARIESGSIILPVLIHAIANSPGLKQFVGR